MVRSSRNILFLWLLFALTSCFQCLWTGQRVVGNSMSQGCPRLTSVCLSTWLLSFIPWAGPGQNISLSCSFATKSPSGGKPFPGMKYWQAGGACAHYYQIKCLSLRCRDKPRAMLHIKSQGSSRRKKSSWNKLISRHQAKALSTVLVIFLFSSPPPPLLQQPLKHV